MAGLIEASGAAHRERRNLAARPSAFWVGCNYA